MANEVEEENARFFRGRTLTPQTFEEGATHVENLRAGCEGPLLRAAFSPKAQAELAGLALWALRGDDSLLPDWARTLAERARTNEPDMLGVQVLATLVLPVQRDLALHERTASSAEVTHPAPAGGRRAGWRRRRSD